MFKIITNKRVVLAQATLVVGFSKFSTVPKAQMEAYTKNEQIVLYQYKICPFCNKAKALLNYMDVDFKIVEVSPLTKAQLSFTDNKKVPVAVINENVIADSSVIVDYIVKNQKLILAKQEATLPASFVPADSTQWMEWSDKKLAVMLYPNITRTFSESWECFEYTADVKEWSYIERKVTHLLGAFFMSLANGKIKKKYGIVNEREELKTVLNEWTTAIKGKDFLHGQVITLPDLMVYGVLKSIEGLKTFEEIMASNSELKEWFQRVETTIISRQHHH